MFAGWSTHGIFACPQCMFAGWSTHATLTRDVKRNGRLLELIVSKVQIEIPPELLQEEENELGGALDGSSHASANLDNSDGH